MVTPGIGPATVGLSGFSLLSAAHPAAATSADATSRLMSLFMTNPGHGAPQPKWDSSQPTYRLPSEYAVNTATRCAEGLGTCREQGLEEHRKCMGARTAVSR